MNQVKMKYLLLYSTILFNFLSYCQGVNIGLNAQVDYQQLHNTNLNDIWGYEDQAGNEYAIVGAQKGVSIVDVTDPSNPNEVYWHPASEGVWRDLKEFNGYAYITTEEVEGLLIIDMNPLPNDPIVSTNNYYGPTGDQWSTAHNLWIDENGFAYIFGSNRGNGGVIILDLNTDPMNPTEVGTFDDWYVHDGFVRGDTMYLAHIYEGFFSLVDVSDKSNPVLLGTQVTPSSFAHNIWPTDDGKHVFTTDEVTNAYLGTYNVEDPSNISLTDRIQSSPGDGVVPHNAHVYGDFLVTSYYADGVVIHDISDPENMVEVASYDTYPGTSTSTEGCWGAYPYLPSGTLLVTDIENGLFVLDANYQYAAKLEGTVTDELTGDQLQGVEIEIVGHDQIEKSDLQGAYKTGIGATDTYDITYTKYGYEQKTITETLTMGDTLFSNVELTPLPPFNLTINVNDEAGLPITNAPIRLAHDSVEIDGQTNGLGEASFTLYYEDDYEVTIGKWSYFTLCEELVIDETTATLNYELGSGYYDDFSFDYGWSSFGTATDGLWERAIPNPTGEDPSQSINPYPDSDKDCGDYAFVTGNDPTTNDNVSNGSVTLISPVFDLSSYDDPYIHFERWFFNFFGPENPDDTLFFRLSNGVDNVIIDNAAGNPANFHKWISVTKRVQDYLAPTATMQLIITTSDEFATRNFVEAGVDHFYIVDEAFLTTDEVAQQKWAVYPNPFKEAITIDGIEKGSEISLYDIQGKLLIQKVTQAETATISTVDLVPGCYFVKLNGKDTKKIIKN